jgi:hypothetical protein
LHLGQQIGDGAFEHGVNESRYELGQRLQHEQPLVQARMRDDEAVVAVDKVAIQQQIEIDGPRSIALLAHAPQSLLDRQQRIEEIVGRAIGPHLDDGVEVVSLPRRPADRPRLVHRRYACDLDTLTLTQVCQCALQVVGAIVEVAAQSNINEGHFSLSQWRIIPAK